MITSVDKEGTGEGYDFELIRKISDSVGIPVIAHGGASSPANALQAVNEGHADALAIASIFHYDIVEQLSKNSDTEREGNTSFLKSGRNFGIIQASSIKEVKEHLIEKGISCRPI